MWKRNSARSTVFASQRIRGALALSSSPVMARYELIDTNPMVLAVNLAAQLLPETLARALQHLFTEAIALSRAIPERRDRGAHFMSTLVADIAPIFASVLAVCDRQGLIGREVLAIDGVKLPSNARRPGGRDAHSRSRHAQSRRTVSCTRALYEHAGSVARQVARGEGVAPGICVR